MGSVKGRTGPVAGMYGAPNWLDVIYGSETPWLTSFSGSSKRFSITLLNN